MAAWIIRATFGRLPNFWHGNTLELAVWICFCFVEFCDLLNVMCRVFNESPVCDNIVINDRWGNDTLWKHGTWASFILQLQMKLARVTAFLLVSFFLLLCRPQVGSSAVNMRGLILLRSMVTILKWVEAWDTVLGIQIWTYSVVDMLLGWCRYNRMENASVYEDASSLIGLLVSLECFVSCIFIISSLFRRFGRLLKVGICCWMLDQQQMVALMLFSRTYVAVALLNELTVWFAHCTVFQNLLEIGNWLNVNGEAIFKSQPWVPQPDGAIVWHDSFNQNVLYTFRNQVSAICCLTWTSMKHGCFFRRCMPFILHLRPHRLVTGSNHFHLRILYWGVWFRLQRQLLWACWASRILQNFLGATTTKRSWWP